jgi:hypothetical protein
VYKNLVL